MTLIIKIGPDSEITKLRRLGVKDKIETLEDEFQQFVKEASRTSRVGGGRSYGQVAKVNLTGKVQANRN